MRIFCLIVALLVMVPLAVGAQSAQFDGDRLLSNCRQQDCVRGVQTAVGQILLTRPNDADFDSQLGVIATMLIAAASGAEPDLVGQISQGLALLASYSTDPRQAGSFIWVADQVASGVTDLFDLASPFAASPS